MYYIKCNVTSDFTDVTVVNVLLLWMSVQKHIFLGHSPNYLSWLNEETAAGNTDVPWQALVNPG